MNNQVILIGGVVGAGISLGLLIAFIVTARRHKHSTPKHTQAPSLTENTESSDIILGAIDDGVLLLDHEGVIKVFNPGASRITGWQPDEATGLACDSVIKLADEKHAPYDEQQNPFRRVIREGVTLHDNSAMLVSRSERYIPLSLTVSPLIDSESKVYGVVAIFRDVSKERQQEAQRGEFISTASHEMRTPIAAIEGYLSLALNSKVEPIGEKTTEYLTKAYNATKHLGKLFQDLLSSSQAEDGRLTINPTVIDVGMFMESLLQDLRFSADKKGLSVELVMGNDTTPGDGRREAHAGSEKVIKPLYYVYADADRLREVISNIFDNAVKYTPSGTVSIGLTGDAEVVQLYVRDTGMGIAPEDIPHLFQKFYRIDNSDTRTIGGTGLGLFLSRMIIEQSNGKIWVTSEPGKGSTFYINLPRLSTTEATSRKAQASTTQTPTMVQ